MIQYLLEKGQMALLWFSNPANRSRLKGARVEVVAFLIAREPNSSVVLAESAYDSAWMPPQEGVRLKESFEEAFYRCVQDECCINVPPDPRERGRLFYFRHIEYLGILDLPRERWGERLVADDAADTPLSQIQLRKKAYWAAIAILKATSDMIPKPDGKEIVNVGWFEFHRAREVIQKTNRAEKSRIILKGLDICQKHLRGVSRHAS